MGGVGDVCSAMETLPFEVRVQSDGCRALTSLADDNNGNDTIRIAIGRPIECHAIVCDSAQTGIGLVLDAMRNHRLEFKVQRACLQALSSIAYNVSENQKQIVSSGGLENVFWVMSNFGSGPSEQNAVLLSTGCKVLKLLSNATNASQQSDAESRFPVCFSTPVPTVAVAVSLFGDGMWSVARLFS